jgi:hypothetical protein
LDAAHRRVAILTGPLKPADHANLLGEYSAVRAWARDKRLEHRLLPPPPPELDTTFRQRAAREAELQIKSTARARRRASK